MANMVVVFPIPSGPPKIATKPHQNFPKAAWNIYRTFRNYVYCTGCKTVKLGRMIESSEVDSRALLRAWRTGDRDARDRLFELFYPDLERMAAAMLRRERGVSLATADLVQESVLRLVVLERIAWTDRAHFMALSATMMRRALLDYLRGRRALKREHEKIALSTGMDAPDYDHEVEALSAALTALSLIDRQRAEIVEMRYFGGMENRDIAEVLGCSEATVKRRWSSARLWLLAELSAD